jgi:hypothetical protein
MSSPKERGFFLDIWMSILLFVNIGGLIWYLGGYLTTFASPNRIGFLPYGVTWIFLECTYLVWNIICLSLMFKWRKWGFFGYFGGILLVLAVNIYFGAGAFAFLGLGGVGILSLALRPKWKLFQ